MRKFWVIFILMLTLPSVVSLMAVRFERNVLAWMAERPERLSLTGEVTPASMTTLQSAPESAVETAVIISQMTYRTYAPAAVLLVNRENLVDVLLAASALRGRSVDAALLYVDESSIPPLTLKELLRLKPKGLEADGGTQVYLIGDIAPAVQDELAAMGFRTRLLSLPDQSVRVFFTGPLLTDQAEKRAS